MTLHKPTLLLGRSGRVGGMLAQIWKGQMQDRAVLTQARHGPCDLTWDPLVDGAAPLVEFSERHGGLSASLIFLGSTPATAGTLDRSAELVETVLDAARLAGTRRVLIASSSAVYGPGQMLDELSPCLGTSPYAHAKIEVENVARPFRQRGMDVCRLRIGNVAGSDALLGARDAPEPRQIDQYADGEGPIRSYIGPVALARCLEALVAYPAALPEVLNVAGIPPVSMRALVEARGLSWRWSAALPGTSHLQRITLDCSRLCDYVDPAMLKTDAKAIAAELDALDADLETRV